jgi:hypothetical protein
MAMAGMMTDLQRRVNRLERQLGRRHFVDDLHARIERLERQIGRRRFAARPQPPPVASFQGVMLGVLLGMGLDQFLVRWSGRKTGQQVSAARAGLTAQANELAGAPRSETAARAEPARPSPAGADMVISETTGADAQADSPV